LCNLNVRIARVLPLLVMGALAWTMAFAASASPSESPTEVVRGTLTEVFRILDDPKLKEPTKATGRRQKLEEVISSRFDYAEMSKRTLAAQWSKLTPAQRTQFVDLFKAFLSDRYAGRIEDYSGEQVQYLSERLEGPYAEVRTKLVSSKTEIPMDYRLINKDGRWYAYDIIADGISLVKNYRSQFEKIIRSDSYEELVTRLQNRTVPDDKEKNQKRAERH
jgi:phospholipid transport system substrate-binding protein